MFQLQTATATIDFETYTEAREAQVAHPERLGSVIVESVPLPGTSSTRSRPSWPGSTASAATRCRASTR